MLDIRAILVVSMSDGITASMVVTTPSCASIVLDGTLEVDALT